MSSSQQLSSEPVRAALETMFLAKLRSKMLAGAAMLRMAVRAIQERYGEERVQVIHRAFRERVDELGRQQAREADDHSLRAFRAALEARYAGTHECTKVKNTAI